MPGLTNHQPVSEVRQMADANSIVTRKQAKQLGLVKYFTGKPCPQGHVAHRFTSYGQCEVCVAASRDAWYHANKERAAEKNAKWMASNKPRKRETNSAWRKRHPEQAKAAIEAHYSSNPEMYATYRSNRRARKRAAPGGGITPDDIRRISEAQAWRCACCKEKKPLTLDHIIPLARGGAHDASNAQMLCKSCNSSKGAKDPLDFAQSRGMLL
jgi:5-methylcytosine-specific restriction endonuclease McrA